MHHAEQPALPRVRDVRRRAERAVQRQRNESRLSYPIVDAVVYRLVVDEPRQRTGIAELRVLRDVVWSRAEANAAEQMFDEEFPAGHRRIRPPAPAQVKTFSRYKTRPNPKSSSPLFASPRNSRRSTRAASQATPAPWRP